MGTRFLPATKVIPKELLPVVDKPLVQYAVEEAEHAGITRIIFVTGRGKQLIQEHFSDSDCGPVGRPTSDITLVFTRQGMPAGLGHAIWAARHLVEDEPFAVLLPDAFFLGAINPLSELLAVHAQFKGGVVAVARKPTEQIGKYAVITPGTQANNVIQICGIIEKPEPSQVTSNLCVLGRYILPGGFCSGLATRAHRFGAEVQLTDAIDRLLPSVPFHGVETTSEHFDCGDKIGYLHANLVAGLSRSDLGQGLRQVLCRVSLD